MRRLDASSPSAPAPVRVVLMAAGLAGILHSVPADAQPWPTFAVDSRLRVTVGDVRLDDVVSVEGPLYGTAVVTFREGGDQDVVRKSPGLTTPGDLIVRRHVRTDAALWEWYQQVRAGTLQRKDVSVLYLATRGQRNIQFDLVRCFPSAYALHAGAGASGTVAVEAVTISCEGATRVQP